MKLLIPTLGVCAMALLGADAIQAQSSQGTASYDILIKNARILDGTGSPSFSGIIAISNGHIAAIGALNGPLAKAGAKKM